MKRKLDKATPLGFLIALGCIGGSIVMEHGNLGSYINISAGMIVFGGTFGIAFIAFPMSVVKKMPRLIRLAFKEPVADARQIVQQFVHLAGRARKEGLLALEQEVAAIEYPLLKKGISLVVDGTDPEVVKQVLEIDVMAREARHEVGIGLFEGLGGYAPTLGIVGTVLGLVRILGNMSNAAELGPSIAVAFIATLYGIGSANIVWLPLASKLKRQSATAVGTVGSTLGTSSLNGMIQQAAAASGVSASLIAAVVQAESGGDATAVSGSGAKGLMQLMDGTAAAYGVTNSFDPQQNLMGGSRFLRSMLDQFGGNAQLALAAYNAGPAAVTRYGGVPPYGETQSYVQKVLAAAQQNIIG